MNIHKKKRAINGRNIQWSFMRDIHFETEFTYLSINPDESIIKINQNVAMNNFVERIGSLKYLTMLLLRAPLPLIFAVHHPHI